MCVYNNYCTFRKILATATSKSASRVMRASARRALIDKFIAQYKAHPTAKADVVEASKGLLPRIQPCPEPPAGFPYVFYVSIVRTRTAAHEPATFRIIVYCNYLATAFVVVAANNVFTPSERLLDSAELLVMARAWQVRWQRRYSDALVLAGTYVPGGWVDMLKLTPDSLAPAQCVNFATAAVHLRCETGYSSYAKLEPKQCGLPIFEVTLIQSHCQYPDAFLTMAGPQPSSEHFDDSVPVPGWTLDPSQWPLAQEAAQLVPYVHTGDSDVEHYDCSDEEIDSAAEAPAVILL
eukprot:TRINITY_DN11967_c0_g1_i1.p1 TRINITY_DN11967_c0_g1~~TRINITY_DN11967_c0_g1_i1.p1  ORF type:complete len:293 (-),score=52.32 TRINITY_DN11967_c0_g1_i1:316-1194(-)